MFLFQFSLSGVFHISYVHRIPMLEIAKVETGFPGRTLGGAASAAGISSHGDGLLVLLDVLEELDSSLQLPAVDGLSGLSGVLEGNSEVGTAGAGRLRGLDLGRGVSNLKFSQKRQTVSMFALFS